MEKTRVKKGEKYWYIIFPEMLVTSCLDRREEIHDIDYENGNYFNTKEEAESMARKLRAVFKGAEVIEMPSEKEIIKKSEEIAEIDIDEAYMAAEDMANFFKSKIVK